MAGKIDWSKLGFEYVEINSHMRSVYKDGAWGPLEEVAGMSITLHLGASVLHYGQAVFEGLKAFHCRDGKIRIFRPDMNAKRMADSAERLMMPAVPEALYVEAVKAAVRNNREFVPPFETGGSLYIRPFLIGSGPVAGLKPSPEYTFIVIVTPVGSYYSADSKGVSALIMDDFDRAAAKGLGSFKVAGNYAGALLPNSIAGAQGHPVTLFLDPIEHKYIEEFNSSNFVAVTKDGVYLTPLSNSILPSITNRSLIELAKDENIKVEERRINFEEEVESFAEVGAVGTAVIITPIARIVRGDRVYPFSSSMGPVLSRLFTRISEIRAGDAPDKFGWMVEI